MRIVSKETPVSPRASQWLAPLPASITRTGWIVGLKVRLARLAWGYHRTMVPNRPETVIALPQDVYLPTY